MSLSQRVLKTLETAIDLVNEVDGLKYLPYQMIWGSNIQGYKRSSVQATISRLNRNGLIKKRKDKGQVYLGLTEKGESFLYKRPRLNPLKLETKEKKWDKLYRFVCFDIAESERVIRDQLRGALKSSGAVCWQRSIWVTRANVTRQLNEFFEDNGLEDSCTVLEVRDIYSLKLKKLLEKN